MGIGVDDEPRAFVLRHANEDVAQVETLGLRIDFEQDAELAGRSHDLHQIELRWRPRRQAPPRRMRQNRHARMAKRTEHSLGHEGLLQIELRVNGGHDDVEVPERLVV